MLDSDVKERVTKELREINVNLTKEEESFLDYTPIPGAEYRVVDHLRKCEAKHKDTGKVSTTNDPAAQTRTKKIKLRIDTFLKKKSVISFVGGFFNFLEFLSGLMDATLDAVTSDYVIGFKVMMLVVKVSIITLFARVGGGLQHERLRLPKMRLPYYIELNLLSRIC